MPSSTRRSSTSISAGRNSFLVADALKQRGIPFAFATGDSGVDASAGFDNPILLAKPFDFESVKAVLAKLLQAPTPGH